MEHFFSIAVLALFNQVAVSLRKLCLIIEMRSQGAMAAHEWSSVTLENDYTDLPSPAFCLATSQMLRISSYSTYTFAEN